MAQAPIAMQYFGSGIWFQRRTTSGAIFLVTVPETISEVGLTGEWAEDLGAEAGDVETGCGGGDHLDRAAGEAELEGPDGVAAAPVVELFHAGEQNAVAA